MSGEKFHIGHQIERVINQKHMMKCVLADRVGLSNSAVIRLRDRENIDVALLQKIGNVLGYDFFKHYAIDDGEAVGQDMAVLNAQQAVRIAELEGELKELRAMEINYLRMSNEQLREAQKILYASLGPNSSLKPALRKGNSAKGSDKGMLFG